MRPHNAPATDATPEGAVATLVKYRTLASGEVQITLHGIPWPKARRVVLAKLMDILREVHGGATLRERKRAYSKLRAFLPKVFELQVEGSVFETFVHDIATKGFHRGS